MPNNPRAALSRSLIAKARRCRGGLFLCTLLAAIALATAPAAQPRQIRKPLTFSILEDYDKGDDLQDVARDFTLMRELGIDTWRGSVGWDDFEPDQRRYDFAWLHDFIALAAARGITLRPYLGYTPDWAAGAGAGENGNQDGQAWNQPPKDQRAWQAFVGALSAELRHHRNVPSLEIYNEENVTQWWEGTRAQYAETLATASRAARRQRAFQILAGGLVFPDAEWIEDVCAQRGIGSRFDIVSVHAYPETWTPDGVTVENYFGAGFAKNFVRVVDRACGRKRVWVNETGFATTPGKSERDQAAWWIRAFATFAAEPRIEHIGVYEIKDLAPGKEAIGDAPNYHLGIMRADRTPKMAFATVKRLVDLFGTRGTTIADSEVRVEPLESSGELHYHAFARPDGDRILFVWNRTGDQNVRVVMSAQPSAITEYALDGSLRPETLTSPFEAALARGTPRMFRWSVQTGSARRREPE